MSNIAWDFSPACAAVCSSGATVRSWLATVARGRLQRSVLSAVDTTDGLGTKLIHATSIMSMSARESSDRTAAIEAEIAAWCTKGSRVRDDKLRNGKVSSRRCRRRELIAIETLPDFWGAIECLSGSGGYKLGAPIQYQLVYQQSHDISDARVLCAGLAALRAMENAKGPRCSLVERTTATSLPVAQARGAAHDDDRPIFLLSSSSCTSAALPMVTRVRAPHPPAVSRCALLFNHDTPPMMASTSR